MRQAAPDAAVLTSHAFYEVVLQHTLGSFHEGDLAFFDAAAGQGITFEIVIAMLVERLLNSCRHAAAARKDAAKIGGVVKRACSICERSISRLSSSAKAPQGDHAIHNAIHCGSWRSFFFAIHGPIKTIFAVGSIFEENEISPWAINCVRYAPQGRGRHF